MKLNFGEILRKYRRERDLTQEELAQDIGISSQSVSKWERNDGYPDIELLPVIANYFGVTIDTLLGNDKTDEDMLKEYNSKSVELRETPDKLFELTMEYFRKYPNSGYCDAFAWSMCLTFRYSMDDDMKKKYLPLLKEVCEKTLSTPTDRYFREGIISCMSMYCDDDEFKKWYDLCSNSYASINGEVLERRLWTQNKFEESRIRYDVNNLNIILHFFYRENRNWAAPERAAEWFKELICLVEYFGENGIVPQAWLGGYANWHFRAGCALFGCGRREEGYKYLDRAFELLPCWLEIPDGTPMELGRKALFGEIRAVKGEIKILLPDGTQEYLYEEARNAFAFNPDAGFMYDAMTREQGWEWFDSVRGEDLFKEYVENARLLMEKYTPAE